MDILNEKEKFNGLDQISIYNTLKLCEGNNIFLNFPKLIFF